jgi:hypothetical protein
MIDPGRHPLTIALAALMATFLITRFVTRMIRAGRGPFRDVSPGGLHIHHVVPGIILVLAGGFLAIGTDDHRGATSVAAAVFGIGAGLVLDEFALIVHLHDVYWTEQGRASVEATVLTVCAVGLGVAGFVPLDLSSPDGEDVVALLSWIFWLLFTAATAAITFAKGKFRVGVVGLLVPIVLLVAAVRLARPGSPWANRFYRSRPHRAERAARRARRDDARWAPIRRRLQDLVAGAPTSPPPGDRQ